MNLLGADRREQQWGRKGAGERRRGGRDQDVASKLREISVIAGRRQVAGWKNRVGRYGAVLKLHRQLPGHSDGPTFCHTAAVLFFFSAPAAPPL